MSIERTKLPTQFMRSRDNENADVKKCAATFQDRFDGDDANVDSRKSEATTLVNEYYDLVTDFYEYGWGQAFHFAPRYATETFEESLTRYEHFLCSSAGFKSGQKVLDLGSGVGGPLRNMVRFSGVHVTGVNNNAYQIQRSKRYDNKVGLGNYTSYVRTDFCNISLPDESYDGAYGVEAICHAGHKVECYKEVFRLLKPGSAFACYEWILTDMYDDSNEEHRRVRHGIELGNGLPSLETARQVLNQLEEAGFEVEVHYDEIVRFNKSGAKQIDWWAPLKGNYSSLMGLRSTTAGRWLTNKMVRSLEVLRLAPKGTAHASDILEEAAVNLVKGGELGIFTPSYFFVARKPATKKE